MTVSRPGIPGATRSCPHCRATILDSAAVCPACRHHLRFEAREDTARDRATSLLVEGILRAEGPGEAIEYTMVLVIRDERGEEVARHVAGVGALEGTQTRSFSVAVETHAMPAKSRRR